MIEEKSDQFRKNFKEKEEELVYSISELKFLYQSAEFSSIDTPVNEAMRKLEIHSQKLKHLDEFNQLMLFYSKQMGFEMSPGIEDVEAIKKDFGVVNQLWHQYSDFLQLEE